MRGFAIVSKGIEDIAALEIKELINTKCEVEQGCVIFEIGNISDLCLLCYKSQSTDRILYLICSFEFNNFFNEFEKFIDNSEINKWVKQYKTFKIECMRIGTHNFKSIDVESKIADYIQKKSEDNIRFNIKDYEIIFLIYIVNNKAYFGIDFVGFELNKRSYKIFLHPNSLRGTIAYALIKESGFEKNDLMLDPFSRDGVIPIETAFYTSNFPHNYYKKDKFAFLKLKLGIDFEKFFKNTDKKIKKPKAKIYSYDHLFKYVDYSRKNAKIAGVDKLINFSRTELEWLDIKFKKESVDKIITNPPSSKTANLYKVYNEFFYQCEYILKKESTIALITKMPEFVKKHAEKYNFIIYKEKEVWTGEQLLKIIVFKKKNI